MQHSLAANSTRYAYGNQLVALPEHGAQPAVPHDWGAQPETAPLSVLTARAAALWKYLPPADTTCLQILPAGQPRTQAGSTVEGFSLPE